MYVWPIASRLPCLNAQFPYLPLNASPLRVDWTISVRSQLKCMAQTDIAIHPHGPVGNIRVCCTFFYVRIRVSLLFSSKSKSHYKFIATISNKVIAIYSGISVLVRIILCCISSIRSRQTGTVKMTDAFLRQRHVGTDVFIRQRQVGVIQMTDAF